MCQFVCIRGLRLDQQQSVIELNVGVAELESLKCSVALAVSRTVEVARSSTLNDGLRQHAAVFQAWKVKVPKRVFPEVGGLHGRLVGLPI